VVGSTEAGDSTQAQLLVQQAQDELRAQQLGPAIDKLHQAQRLAREWAVPHQWLALAYQASGDKQAAISEYAAVQRRSLVPSRNEGENPAGTEELVVQCEALTMWLVNHRRWQGQRQLLLPNPLLSQVARQHSMEMRDLNYFSHASPTAGKENVLKRFELAFGFRPRWVGENCGRRWGTGSNYLTPEKITQTHQNFLSKPGHCRAILLPEFNHIGAGIAVNDNGDYWLTEMMATYGGN